MRIAIVTLAVPPFDYRSPWWWMMGELTEGSATVDLVGPSDIDQFQRGETDLGVLHRLNIFADEETDWTERERVEFSVKAYVYLSKLQRREGYDRIVVADCAGIEPLIVANLSVLAPVWVKVPPETASPRGASSGGLLEEAERRFTLSELGGDTDLSEWPPTSEDWEPVLEELLQ